MSGWPLNPYTDWTGQRTRPAYGESKGSRAGHLGKGNLLEGESTPLRIGCDYADCAEQATTALRFGDGTMRVYPNMLSRQSFAFYCRRHADHVQRTFVTCDERPIA